MTDLALALQVNSLSGQSLPDWFSAPNTGSADLKNVEDSLVAAADTLRLAMASANFSLPADWNTGSTAIFDTPFNANPSSDPYDQLLESLAASINDDANLADYLALMSSLVSGGTFPTAPSNGGGNTPDDSANALLSALAGDYSPVVVNNGVAWAGGISYDGYTLPTLGSVTELNISDTGIATIGDHTFDPSATLYTFEDRSSIENAIEFYYWLSTENDTGDILNLAIFLEPSNKEPIAWRLIRQFSRGEHASTTVTNNLEERPIPEAVTTLFTDLKNLGATELTLVNDIPPVILYTTLNRCDKARFDMIEAGSSGYAWEYQMHALNSQYYRFGIGDYIRSAARRDDLSQDSSSRTYIFRDSPIEQITLSDTDNYVDIILYTKTGLKPVLTNDPTKIVAAGCELNSEDD